MVTCGSSRGALALVLSQCLLCFVCAADARAIAASSTVHLTLEAPSDALCTSKESLEWRVEQRLGRAVFVEDGRATRELFVVLREDDARGFSGTLRLSDRAGVELGSRALTSQAASCSELDASLVLIIATLLGLSHAPEQASARAPAREAPQAAEPASLEPASLEPAALATPARAALVTRVERPARHVRLLLGGLLASGPLPGLQAGLGAGVDTTRRGWTLRASLLAWPGAELDLGRGASARFAAVLARLQVCGAALERPPHQLAVCGGTRVGAIVSSTRGLAQDARTRRVEADLELALRYEAALFRQLGGYVSLGATLPITLQRFFIVESDDQRRTYHQTRPGVTAELGAIFRLAP
ncbi:MAG: hypothetical protein JWN48_4815 [Myxococcaceae bacterium]|nr:hypothetical protein [Myxococcaceae bacterium]